MTRRPTTRLARLDSLCLLGLVAACVALSTAPLLVFDAVRLRGAAVPVQTPTVRALLAGIADPPWFRIGPRIGVEAGR